MAARPLLGPNPDLAPRQAKTSFLNSYFLEKIGRSRSSFRYETQYFRQRFLAVWRLALNGRKCSYSFSMLLRRIQGEWPILHLEWIGMFKDGVDCYEIQQNLYPL
jgi:hypothetical protein